MHVKKGDNIIVLAGADKGKKGPIVKVLMKDNMVVVEGINMKEKHQKARRQGRKGQMVSSAYPIHVSNVRLSDAKTKKKAK